jgi:hypothetical protein
MTWCLIIRYIFMAWDLVKHRDKKSLASSVGIETDYGLDDRGTNTGGGWEFFSSTPLPDQF